MKTPPLRRFFPIHSLTALGRTALVAGALLTMLAPWESFAVSAAWNVNGNGNWNVNGNWTPNSGFPNGSGETATFSQTGFTGTRSISLNGTNVTVGTISVFNGLLWEINNNQITLAGAASMAIAGSTTSFTINSTLAGTAGFTKTSGGTLVLIGNNTGLSGTIAHAAGTIRISNANALGTGAVNISNPTSASTLELQGGISVGNAVTLDHSHTGVNRTVTLANLSGDNTFTNTFTVSGTTPIIRSDAGNLTFEGNLVGAATELHFTGAGTKTIAGSANTYSGQTHVLGGTLVVTGSNSGAGSHTISSGATLQVGINTATGSLGSGSIANAGTLRINRTGNLDVGNTISGAGNFVHNGSGITTLSANNSYLGATLVTAGTLVIDGNQSSATGAVTVDSGATLAGSGTIGGATTIAGHHTPGNSPGIQNFASNLSYTNGSSVTWELIDNTNSELDRGISFDGINVGGDLTITGTSTINLVFNLGGSDVLWSNSFWDTDRSWLFYDVAGSLSGAFALGSISLDSAGNSLGANRGSFAITYQGSDVFLTYSAIPEPSTTLLLAGALTALIIFRRRRAS